MAGQTHEQATVELQSLHPQIGPSDSATFDAAGNPVPGAPTVAYGIVGTVNGEGPIVAHVPHQVVAAAGSKGYAGPGLHQIFAEALHEAWRRGHHAPAAAHLAGQSVNVGEGVEPEPTPAADTGSQSGQRR